MTSRLSDITAETRAQAAKSSSAPAAQEPEQAQDLQQQLDEATSEVHPVTC